MGCPPLRAMFARPSWILKWRAAPPPDHLLQLPAIAGIPTSFQRAQDVRQWRQGLLQSPRSEESSVRRLHVAGAEIPTTASGAARRLRREEHRSGSIGLSSTAERRRSMAFSAHDLLGRRGLARRGVLYPARGSSTPRTVDAGHSAGDQLACTTSSGRSRTRAAVHTEGIERRYASRRNSSRRGRARAIFNCTPSCVRRADRAMRA